MDPFIALTSPVAAVRDANIDTDVIFPARFLLITEKQGLGRYAFADRPDYRALLSPLDRPVKILLAGDNFGCGSSREQAVWALHDLGVRCIVAPSFGEIFQSNCYKNGMLPITLSPAAIATVAKLDVLTIDLARKAILGGADLIIPFEIPDWRRDPLLKGMDEVTNLLDTMTSAISSFENNQRCAAPWLYRAERLER